MVTFSEEAARKQAIYALARTERTLTYWQNAITTALTDDIPAHIAALEREIIERKAALEANHGWNP